MKYRGTSEFDHGETPTVGVLITNLGTPQAPEKTALRRYLKQFLSDPRVVEVPRLLWWCILHGIILNIRPARSAASYRKIWTEQGSPLLAHTRSQAQALQNRLRDDLGEQIVVDFAMRYGEPSIATAVQNLCDRGARKLLVLPLYPQYSGATTGSTFDALATDFSHRRWLPELRFVTSYHDHPAYIAALCQSITTYRARHGSADKLIFSYHGEPQSYLDEGDPYFCQCHKTTRLVAEQLQLAQDSFETTFQSRFGKAQWLQPYTDATLSDLPRRGVKAVQVICPGFAADCLETLEEIAVENRDYFLSAGGARFDYIPCLNSSAAHLDALAQLVDEQLSGWTAPADDPKVTLSRAEALKLRSQSTAQENSA